MKGFFNAVIVSGILIALAIPAQAKTRLVQFLGPSEFVGNVAAVAATYGLDDLDLSGVNPAEYFCFEMPMVNPATKKVIGRGIDCLDFQPPGADVPNGTPGTAGPFVTPNTATVDVFTFFIMPEGAIVNHGTTTIQPFVPGFGNAGFGERFPVTNPADLPVTHLTGSIPNPAINSIVLGTGAFARKWGNARVSGAVSLADASGNPVFDCLWELNLSPHMGQAD